MPAEEASPSEGQVAAAVEIVLAKQRPKWSEGDRGRFAREVTTHFFEVMPPESLSRRAKEFQEAFAQTAGFTGEELRTPSMLPYDIAQFKWKLDLWSMRGDMAPEEQERVLQQLSAILEWGATEVRRAKPGLGDDQVQQALRESLRETAELSRNPLSRAYKRVLTDEQVNGVKGTFRARLTRPEPFVSRGPEPQTVRLLRRLAAGIASATQTVTPRAVSDLAHKVSVERRELLDQERERREAEAWTAQVSRVAERLEPFEWLGAVAGQLLWALKGEDPWTLGLW